MESKHCAFCGQSFRPHAQVVGQAFCSAPDCQRARRRRWQQKKLQTDPDYRDNQARAQRAWMNRNPNYWQEYRDTHPAYAERNRNQQRARAAKARNPPVAKMDISEPLQRIPSGVYLLRPVAVPGIAKMDEWIVEITLLSTACPRSQGACKEMM